MPLKSVRAPHSLWKTLYFEGFLRHTTPHFMAYSGSIFFANMGGGGGQNYFQLWALGPRGPGDSFSDFFPIFGPKGQMTPVAGTSFRNRNNLKGYFQPCFKGYFSSTSKNNLRE